jgi:dihydroorotate dehydrogenase
MSPLAEGALSVSAASFFFDAEKINCLVAFDNRSVCMLYEKIAKPLLFGMSAENAHHLVISGLEMTGRLPGGTAMLEKMYGIEPVQELTVDLFGLRFSSPVGLAAGLDKNAAAVPGFSSIGFGFMEVGTITPEPQPGNDRPRLFRLPEDEALINRMGFNNVGVQAMAENLRKAANQRRIPVAVNIGKNKTTPNELAERDYQACIRGLYDYGDFFVVNISSPNTPGLRNLQHGDELRRLLTAVNEENRLQSERRRDKRKPVLVKIAPDLSVDDLAFTIETIANSGVAGIIATNTTIDRAGLTSLHSGETGGLSGKPLRQRATEVIRSIYRLTEGKIPIIGCGGIFTAEDAYEKIRAGASLVEIYTALIYKGPELNRELYLGLQKLLRRDGFSHISEAVGADVQVTG